MGLALSFNLNIHLNSNICNECWGLKADLHTSEKGCGINRISSRVTNGIHEEMWYYGGLDS